MSCLTSCCLPHRNGRKNKPTGKTAIGDGFPCFPLTLRRIVLISAVLLISVLILLLVLVLILIAILVLVLILLILLLILVLRRLTIVVLVISVSGHGRSPLFVLPLV